MEEMKITMEQLREQIWDTMLELDKKHSSASTFLYQIFCDSFKYPKLDDVVMNAMMQRLMILPQIVNEDQADKMADSIQMLMRTVAA